MLPGNAAPRTLLVSSYTLTRASLEAIFTHLNGRDYMRSTASHGNFTAIDFALRPGISGYIIRSRKLQ